MYAWSVCLFINIKYTIIKDALPSWVFVVAKQQKGIDTLDQQGNLSASCPRLRFQKAEKEKTNNNGLRV